MNKLTRIEIDGNDGTGKSYFCSKLNAFLKKNNVDGSISVFDRGYLTKATLVPNITNEVYCKNIMPNLRNDTIYIILDDDPKNCQTRIKFRGDSIEQEFHTLKDLTYYQKQYQDIFKAYSQNKNNHEILFFDRSKEAVMPNDKTIETFLENSLLPILTKNI